MTIQDGISVVIPCYRCGDTLGRAFASVLAQSRLPHEIIMVDDCSNDGQKTLDAMRRFQESTPNIVVKIVSLEKNVGPGSARNAGWDLATQPLIAFLDADDSWHPQKLEIQGSLMLSHPEIDLTGHTSINLAKERPPAVLPPLQSLPISTMHLLLSNCLPMRSVMLKRCLEQRFCSGKRQAEDYLLWLTLAYLGRRLELLNLPLSYSYKEDFGEDGLSAQLSQGYSGVVDTYKQLLEAGYISKALYVALIFLAYPKYIRRQCISMLRSWFRD
jgi:glycosyltransferase involved in cell wall biosynthesis